jgi:hypothetical protein
MSFALNDSAAFSNPIPGAPLRDDHSYSNLRSRITTGSGRGALAILAALTFEAQLARPLTARTGSRRQSHRRFSPLNSLPVVVFLHDKFSHRTTLILINSAFSRQTGLVRARRKRLHPLRLWQMRLLDQKLPVPDRTGSPIDLLPFQNRDQITASSVSRP